jgi:hypothetical protein
MRRIEWFRGTCDERLFAVTISAVTRLGRTTLHHFCFDNGWWRSMAMPTQQQVDDALCRDTNPDFNDVGEENFVLVSRRPDLGVPYGICLGFPEAQRTIHLARGVDVASDTLALILDAVRSDGRHEVEIRDINTVVSQLDSAIAQLPSLPADTRQLAERALYAEILRRCTHCN